MSLRSLQHIEERLQQITSTYSPDDWKDNKDELSRIRVLTFERTDSAVERPQPPLVKQVAVTLEQLLELPDEGQSSVNPIGRIPDTLENEKEVEKLCEGERLQSKAILVAKAVYRSLARSEDIYADIWNNSSNFYNDGETTACRLLKTDDIIANDRYTNAARYRVNALLFAMFFRTKCEELKSGARRETVVIQQMMDESGKTIDQIKTLLKRGRWYALWVSELGLGAILVLGESLAWNNQMHDIGRLIKVCTSMPGFCNRSRKLSGLARRAIAQAIFRSGQPAPLAAQRYIDFPDMRAMSSGEHNRSTMLGTADHHTPNDFPFIQLAGEPTQELQTTEYPSMPEQAAVRQRINPQWRANAEIGGHQATAAQYPFFRPSPNANDPMPATLAHVGDAAPQPGAAGAAGAADYPMNHAQYLTVDQRYGGMSARHAGWDGTSYGSQSEMFDPELWCTRFSN